MAKREATYKVRFGSVYARTKAPRPVVVKVSGDTPLERECQAIIKAYEIRGASDEAFRAYTEVVEHHEN